MAGSATFAWRRNSSDGGKVRLSSSSASSLSCWTAAPSAMCTSRNDEWPSIDHRSASPIYQSTFKIDHPAALSQPFDFMAFSLQLPGLPDHATRVLFVQSAAFPQHPPVRRDAGLPS